MSSESSIEDFVPGVVDEAEQLEELKLAKTLTNLDTDNLEDREEYIRRIENLSRQLSRRSTAKTEFEYNSQSFDLQKTLYRFVKLANKQGIHFRSSGISFKDIFVTANDQLVAVAPTVGQILTGPYDLVKAIINGSIRQKTPQHEILKNINGYAKPGEMVLVLGRPGAGCSTLLKKLAGTDLEVFNSHGGEVFYDGITQEEMLAKFKADVIYNPELDFHMPHLTVEQTLRFAVAMKTPQTRINGVSRDQYITTMVEILATVFGLRHTYNTKVGNDYVRGVSGGERKRVSIAEALACRGTFYSWDNATRGLDASTALEYAQAIRASTTFLNTTAFVTIYQAGENIYENFDKVTILYSGKQIYFGPIEEAKSYFVNMGWECPPRQSTPEFLTAVTDPNGRFIREGFENKVPRTALDFEHYWHNSPEFKRLIDEIDDYNAKKSDDETREAYYKSIKQEKHKRARESSKFTVSYYEQLRLCTLRRYQAIMGDKAYTVTQIMASLAQGLIVGSLYYNTSDTVTGAFSRGGVVFFSVLYVSLVSLAEVTATFDTRPILTRHKNYSLYHTSADALANTLLKLPLQFIICVAFIIILYFLSNLAREAGKFFLFFLFVYILSLTIGSMFRAVASLCQTIAGANTIAGLLLLAILMYSSYMIQKPSMRWWFKWLSFINPLLYGFEAVISSEFHGRKMECVGQYLTPFGPSYQNLAAGEQVCSFTGSKAGQTWVSGDDYLRIAYTYSFTHVWRNFGILMGFLIFFVALDVLFVEYVKSLAAAGDKLIFLNRQSIPDTLVFSEDNPSASDSGDVEKDGQVANGVFEDLKSRDIFVWQHVNYVIPYKGAQRTLLDDVSGYCVPGTLTALMGESGAGKTTLLNTLAQRIDFGTITGDMLVNGKPLDHSFPRRTGYVQQQDIHVAEMTVRELLRFAARLRRSNDVSDEEKLSYVEKIIDILEMTPYADAVVGPPGGGLNVEQKKKLSIAVELVVKPSLLLFLDEPTSGLDSQSAWAIVKLLRSLSEAGQSILCTIHQPSATLFEAFDRLLLLKKGGQTVYFGDIGNRSKTLLNYFETHGARHCEDNENPAEYILEAIGAGATATTDQDWHEVWKKSEQKKLSDEEGDRLMAEYAKNAGNESHSSSTFATPILYQFKYVLSRNSVMFWRNPEYVMAKFMLSLCSGLFIGFTFFGIKHSIIGMQNGLFTGFITCVVAAPLINQLQAHAIAGRDLYEVREKMSKTYHWSLMIWSQFINELPYSLVSSTVMFLCVYFPTQADTSGPHAGIFYLTFGIFFQLYYVLFGLAILYFSPDVELAAILVSFFYSFIVSFSGVVQPTSLMPGFWTFMNKVSPYTYFIDNLVSSILHKRKITCSARELAYFNPRAGQTCYEYTEEFLSTRGGYLTNPNATSQCGYCPYTVADDYLKTVGYLYSHRWRNVGFFCVYIIFNCATMLFMYYLLRVRTGSLIPSFVTKFFENQKLKKAKKEEQKSQ